MLINIYKTRDKLNSFFASYALGINDVELFNNTIKTHLRYLPEMTNKELIDYAKNYIEKKEDGELMNLFF